MNAFVSSGYKCRECGGPVTVTRAVTGTRTCNPCLKRRYRERDPKRFTASRLCDGARRRAKLRGLEFDLDIEHVLSVSPDHCPVLGLKLNYMGGKLRSGTATLDRLCPKRGYVHGNVAVISARANRIKSDAALAELEQLVAWLRRYEK